MIMKTVAIATLGCKVNQFESEGLAESLETEGYRIVPFGEKADITIVNTCTVTHRADFQSRQMVRRAHRSSPHTLLVVTGCYAQVDPESLSEIEGVKYLVGNQEKKAIPSLLPLMEQGEGPRIQVGDIQGETRLEDTALLSFRHHTRAFLRVQDGCDARCSYCIVPHARGRSRSLVPEKVLAYLKALKRRGYQEVVITGIHLGAYGLDLSPPVSLEHLLERVEAEETPPRIRLSSIEPRDFSPGLLALLSRSTKVCPHLHIPIQSGDDEVLRRMNRGYDGVFLSDLIRELDQRVSDLCIGVDVIAGFPGETTEGFERTFELVQSLPVAYLHVFPFSRRDGTPAAQFPDRVAEGEIKDRAERLRALGREKRQDFYRRFLNQELKVLVEGRRGKEGAWRGFSRNYIPVFLVGNGDGEKGDWTNKEINAVVTELTEKGVLARVAGDKTMDEERSESLKELEKSLGYEFQKVEWLDRALTHKSYCHESSTGQPDPSRENGNEVLEFLGDAVLNLAVSSLLHQAFPEATEGTLSKWRSHLVKRSFLAHLSRELQLERFLLLGKGELLDGGRKKASILANVYEAVIGAVYVDSGFDQALEIIHGHFKSYLGPEGAFPFFNDYKSLLQERAQEVYRLPPTYQVMVESGPDHDKRFEATVLIGTEAKGSGWGKSKKEAEQEAARKALENIELSNDPIQISIESTMTEIQGSKVSDEN